MLNPVTFISRWSAQICSFRNIAAGTFNISILSNLTVPHSVHACYQFATVPFEARAYPLGNVRLSSRQAWAHSTSTVMTFSKWRMRSLIHVLFIGSRKDSNVSPASLISAFWLSTSAVIPTLHKIIFLCKQCVTALLKIDGKYWRDVSGSMEWMSKLGCQVSLLLLRDGFYSKRSQRQ